MKFFLLLAFIGLCSCGVKLQDHEPRPSNVVAEYEVTADYLTYEVVEFRDSLGRTCVAIMRSDLAIDCDFPRGPE